MTITAPSKINNRSSAYVALHIWIKYHYGKASKCEGQDCNGSSNTYQWANITGKYERDIKNFQQLCRSCHARLDMSEYCRKVSSDRWRGNTFRRKNVVQLSKDGKPIKTFPAIALAGQELGILHTSIVNCLAGRTKTAGGYKWQYGRRVTS